MSCAALRLKPFNNPDNLSRLKYLQWEKLLGSVIYYRSGFNEINVPGSYKAFLANRGKLDEFNFGEFSASDELNSLAELARQHPGNYLLLG